MTHSPLVTVLLPVYNSEKFLAESIRSILCQSFEDFELIILNDGSVDRSEEVAKSFTDKRIRYFSHANMGLANTLNKGISLAVGKYIARQDNDDISHPERLQRQISFLEKNRDYVLVGSAAAIINEDGTPSGRKHKHPTRSPYLKLDLIFDNPFVHSSVVFHKEVVQNSGGYISSPDFFEDHNLWSRVSYKHKVANLSDELLLYREVQSGMSKSANAYSKKVSHQCELNLDYYIPHQSENRKISEMFQCMAPSRDDKILYKEIVKQLIEKTFEGETIEEKNIAMRRFELKLKMAQVRHQLAKPDISGIQKLVLKIKRRVIFNRYNHLILSHHF